MPCPLPRGIIRYRVRVTVNGHRVMIGDYDTLTDARNALTIAQADIVRCVFVPPATRRTQAHAEKEAATVSQWAEQWLAMLAEAALASYRSTLRAHILPVIGERTLAVLAQEDVDALLRSCHTRGACTNAAVTLRATLRAAAAEGAGGLTVVPVRIRVPKPDTSSALDASRIATPEHVSALCEAMPPRLALTPMLAAMMALQRGDIEGLDCDGGATLRVVHQWNSKAVGGTADRPKFGSSDVLAVPDVLVPMIVAHLEEHVAPGREAPLFAARGEQRPVPQTAFDKAWRAARETAGLPDYRLHDLRHTGMTMYAHTGATLVEIMVCGRHRNPDVAERYQHAMRERGRTNAARLGAEFTRPGAQRYGGGSAGRRRRPSRGGRPRRPWLLTRARRRPSRLRRTRPAR